MRIFVSLFIIFSSMFSIKPMQISYAENLNEKQYAKVLESCVLYKTKDMINSSESILFEIPETYFVLILENISDDCYKVQYDKYIGYVDSSKLITASFTPIVKTLSNITFDIKPTSGTQIWSMPTTNSDIYTTLGAGTKDITYIASVHGSIPSGGESDVWYYVFYTPSANSTNVYEGYIYSENTTNLSEIISNTETNPEIIIDEYLDDEIIYISSTIKTIIIAVIAIPIILFFVIILYKIVKKVKNNTKYNKNNHSNNDYEFDGDLKNKNLTLIGKFKNMIKLNPNKKDDETMEFDDELL